MKAIDFDGSNQVIAKDQPEYHPLPALVVQDGTVVSCWKMTWKEWFNVLLRRRVWVITQTGNAPLQPLYVDGHCPINYKILNEE